MQRLMTYHDFKRLPNSNRLSLSSIRSVRGTHSLKGRHFKIKTVVIVFINTLKMYSNVVLLHLKNRTKNISQ